VFIQHNNNTAISFTVKESFTPNCRLLHEKELKYRRETAQRAMTVEILTTAAQMYEK